MSLRSRCPGFDAVVGLAGGIGSGKSNVLKELRALGAVCVDGDTVAHSAYLPGQRVFDQLVDAFGGDIVGATGAALHGNALRGADGLGECFGGGARCCLVARGTSTRMNLVGIGHWGGGLSGDTGESLGSHWGR